MNLNYQNLKEKSIKYTPYAILVLVFLLGLGIGVLIGAPQNAATITIDKNMKIGPPAEPAGSAVKNATSILPAGNFFGSINGKAYYPKDCAAGDKIKEENKIWFESRGDAEAQGYKPAQNCVFELWISK